MGLEVVERQENLILLAKTSVVELGVTANGEILMVPLVGEVEAAMVQRAVTAWARRVRAVVLVRYRGEPLTEMRPSPTCSLAVVVAVAAERT